MDEIFKIAGITATISGIIGTLVYYIVKKSVDSFVEIKLENQKLKFNKDLLAFQAKLDNSKETKQLIFKSLHEERAKAMKNIFKKMIHFFDSYRGWVMGIRDSVESEKIKEWYESHMEKQVELVQYMDENRIFFNSNLTKRFDQFQEDIHALNLEANEIFHKESVLDIPYSDGNADIKPQMENYLDKVIATFGPILDTIEIEFKKIIGVE